MASLPCAVKLFIYVAGMDVSRNRALARGRGCVKEKDVVWAYRELMASGIV